MIMEGLDLDLQLQKKHVAMIKKQKQYNQKKKL